MSNPYDDLDALGRGLRAFLEGFLRTGGLGAPQGDRVAKNKEILLAFKKEIFFEQNFDALDKYLAADIKDHVDRPDDPPGIAGVRARFEEWLTCFEFTDHFKPLMIGEGDHVAYTWVNKCCHTGEFMGIEATQCHVDVVGIGIVRFEGDKIAEHWMVFDAMDVCRQIGADVRVSASGTIPAGRMGPEHTH